MTTNQQEDFAVRLCELYEQVTQNNNNNNNHQFTLFVNHAYRTMQDLTDPLIDAMDDEEAILSYQQSKDRVQSLTESTLAQLQQQSSSSSSNSHVMLFLTAYVHMSMAQVLNQSTNDDDVIQENLTRVIQEWNQVIESLSKDEKENSSNSMSSAIVLSQFYRAEANRMLVDRGLDVESAGKEAEKDYLAVIEKVPQFSYAYESLNHVYTGMGSGDENKALAILSKGIDFGLLSASNMSPLDKSILYLARGFYYAYEDGDTEQALVDYKNALECDASCANKIPKKLYQQLNP